MQSDNESGQPLRYYVERVWQVVHPYLVYVGNVLQHRYLTLGTRIVLGGMFLVAGIAELCQIERFVSLARLINFIPFFSMTDIYDISASENVTIIGVLPDTLVRAYGTYLPAVEIIIGILLITGIFLRFSSSISILMLISFIVAKIVKTSHGYELPWGDFSTSTPEYIYGGLSVWLVRLSMAVDFVLLAFAVQIIAHREEFLSLGHQFKLRAIEKRSTEPTD